MSDLGLRTTNTQSAARLFLCVAYVGNLLKEQGIHQARNQDFMWGGANEAKVDQTTEMFFFIV